MLHIILGILKIIGIIILVILTLLLIIAFCVLVVPLRYKGKFKFDKNSYRGYIKGRYLFGLLRFNVNIEKDITYSVKLLFKELISSNLDITKENTKSLKAKVKKQAPSVSGEDIEDKWEDAFANVPKVMAQDNIDNISQDTTEDISQDMSQDNLENKVDSSDDKVNILGTKKNKVENFIEKISSKLIKLKFNFRKFCDKLRKISTRKQEYIDFLKDPSSLVAKTMLKESLYKLFKIISPRNIKGEINFGLEDPATTGFVLGLICIFLPRRFKSLKLVPDFENVVLNGDITFKGHTSLVSVLIIGLKIYRQKRIREFITFVKK